MEDTFIVAPALIILTWCGIIVVGVVAGVMLAKWAVGRMHDES